MYPPKRATTQAITDEQIIQAGFIYGHHIVERGCINIMTTQKKAG